jgi:hypothetical protein
MKEPWRIEQATMNYLAASYEVSTACNLYCQHNWHPKKIYHRASEDSERFKNTSLWLYTRSKKALVYLCVLCVSVVPSFKVKQRSKRRGIEPIFDYLKRSIAVN